MSLVVIAVAGCGRLSFDPSPSTVTRDAPGLDSSTGDAAAVTACPSFAIFCEDFESGSLAQWPTVDIIGPSSAQVTATRPKRGTFALEADKQPSANSGTAAPVVVVGAHSSGVLAVRLWANATLPLVLFNMVVSLSDGPFDNYVTVGGDQLGFWVASESRGASPIDYSSATPATPIDTWVCVELVFTFANPSRIAIRVDDTMVLDVPALTPTPTFDRVRVGAVRGDQTGFHVFVDDVAVANQPIGCN